LNGYRNVLARTAIKPNNRFLSGLPAFAGLLFACALLSAAEPRTPKPQAVNYGRPFERPTRPALMPLPPGAVEPAGWLRDWCLAAKDGYTGHMDEVDPAFRQAWASDYKMTGDRLFWQKGGWPYEGGGYWFDGLARLGFAMHDDSLINQAKTRLNVVINNMNDNGILFIWWLNKNKPEDLRAVVEGRMYGEAEWPIWSNGLFGRALAGYYAGSADPRALRTLESAYSNSTAWAAAEGWGISNIWPAYQTWLWTGNKKIGQALTEFFSKTHENGRWPPVTRRYRRLPNDKPGAEVADHGVHFCESTACWALGYLWTGKREFLDAVVGWYRLVERDCMQPYGVPVFDEVYGPTGAFRSTETCDVAGYIWTQTVLLGISGQGAMADRVERAFFNAGPATVSRDFKTHVYFQSPNRMADRSLPPADQCTFQRKHVTLCCTAALNRILPNYVTHMWMATYDNGLVATHYGPCKLSALAGDRVPVEIVCRTDYPFSEVIEMAVNPAREAAFPLSFRIPGWCKNPELSVNGSAVSAVPDTKGFVRLQRIWKAGDAIRLRFPMSVSVQTGRDSNAQGAPYTSVSYGPLLFALPIADTKDANTPDPAAKWNYALDVQGRELGGDVTVERGAMPAKWDWPLASPLKLQANAVVCDWTPSPQRPLPSAPIASPGLPKRITLIPYGCTKFRVSMFPTTERVLMLSEVEKPPQPSAK
jgi:hypothetical protein